MTLPKLNTRPDEDTARSYVDRIVATCERATPEQVRQGEDWYPAARRVAEECDGDARKGAGIIAALSANKGWGQNLTLARRAFGGVFTGHTGDALRKAQAIYEGAAPESVLPMALKTGQFYLCIHDPADPDAVVIDRHAHDIAAGMKYGNGDRGLDVGSRYESIASAYREAAKRLGRVPCEVQAITWVVITDAARYSRSLTGVPGWGDD